MTFIDEKLSLINAMAVPSPALCTSTAMAPDLDVSAAAAVFGFARPVHMEAESFGVLVTRRPGARADALRGYEQARLLSVLASAAEFIGQCDEEPRQVQHWEIPSDSRDGLPRCMWIQLEIAAGGYRLVLTQL